MSFGGCHADTYLSPQLGRLRQGEHREFVTGPSDRACLKNRGAKNFKKMFARLGPGAYAFDPRTVEAEVGRSVLSRQPGPHRKTTKSSPNNACRAIYKCELLLS